MFILQTFTKSHIFLENRIYSKIKKHSGLYSICGPDDIFLWWKRKKEIRWEISMEFTLSWQLSIFTPSRKAVEVHGSKASKFCHTLIVVQHYSLKVGSICRSCFKTECFSCLLSMLLPFFKRLNINLQCILLLKQPLKDILGRLRHENSGIIKILLFTLTLLTIVFWSRYPFKYYSQRRTHLLCFL